MILLLIKASLIIAFLVMFYKLFLEKESFFATNRIYLLVSLLLACMLPFVGLPKIVEHQGILTSWLVMDNATVIPNKIENALIPEETVLSPDTEKQNVRQDSGSKIKSFSFYLIAIYLLGVFVFLILFISQLLRLIMYIYQSKDKILDTNCTIVNLRSKIEPSSFFRFVFISPELYDYSTYESILKHEQAHVKLRHSLDLVLAEMAIIILWFNPFVWLLRKEVEKNIEYQTDQILINDKTIDNQSYQLSLLGVATTMKPMSLTTNYNQSLIKQRIVKMNSKKSNPLSYCKYVCVMPLVFTLVLIVNQPLDGLANYPSNETNNATIYRSVSEAASTETIIKAKDLSSGTSDIQIIITANDVVSETSNIAQKLTRLNAPKAAEPKSIVGSVESKRDTLENYKLYQNTPNPFRSETVIGFDLPKAASAILIFYNIKGNIVKRVNGDYEKGYSEIKLYASDLVLDGKRPEILYYQLDSENFSATKKMRLTEK